MLEIFKQFKQNERSPNPGSRQSVNFKETGTRQAGQLRHCRGMHSSLGGRVGEEIWGWEDEESQYRTATESTVLDMRSKRN